jgi:hypothetical protein
MVAGEPARRSGNRRGDLTEALVRLRRAILREIAGGQQQVDTRLLVETSRTTWRRLSAVSMPSSRPSASANRWLSESCTSSTGS